ncbi:MAG: copper resistance protein CopC [Dehalococcoidia bacterium]
MNRLRRRRLAALAALVVLLWGGLAGSSPRVVLAHASYLGSDPAADSVVPSAPPTVTIRFSEPMSTTGSSAEVLDSRGRRVDLNDSKVDPNDTTRMSLSLSELADGTYTVAWRNVSAVDGHGLQGSFVFYVGSRPADAPASQVAEPPLLQSRADPIVRWFTLLGAMVATGAVLFEPLVLTYIVQGERRRAVDLALEAARVRIRRVVVAGVAAFLGGSIAQLVLQAGIVANVPAYRVNAGDIVDVLSSAWGWRWAVRGVCLAGVIAVLAAEHRARAHGHLLLGGRGWVPVAALLVVAMAMVSGSSHAAAVGGLEVPGAINDGLHFGASAVWIGGLTALFFTLAAVRGVATTERRLFVTALAARFSLVAGLSVGLVIITGVYSSWLQVTSRAAFDTPYGSILTAKVALVLGLLAVAGLNLLWVRPRLARGLGESGLRRLVAVEIALALLVIGAAAGLTSLEPARQVQSREEQRSALRFGETVEGTQIDGEVGPGTVGANRIAVRLADRSGDAVGDASQVTVRLRYLDRDLSPIEVSATSVGGGRYEAPATVLSIAGAWQIEVDVSRPGAFDARTASRFLVTAGDGPDVTFSGPAVGPSTADGRTYWSWVVMGTGALALVLLPKFWRSRPARARSRIFATAVVLSGVVLFYGGHTHTDAPSSVQALTNPYPPDSRSIEAGRALYEQTCVKCHGTGGHGDGPEAVSLVPPPADLTTHVPLHTDGTVFYFITNGFPGTAMPAFANSLTEEERWHLVNYLRTLSEPLPDR